jgi:hypothetical protein
MGSVLRFLFSLMIGIQSRLECFLGCLGGVFFEKD